MGFDEMHRPFLNDGDTHAVSDVTRDEHVHLNYEDDGC